MTNTGRGAANDVRLAGLTDQNGNPPTVADRDPNRFPAPVTARLAAGSSVLATVRTNRSTDRLRAEISADGGLSRVTT